jgi:hypothetical protein
MRNQAPSDRRTPPDRRQISERRVKVRGQSLLTADVDGRRDLDRRGIARSMADALDDILDWESRRSA